jgi:glycosyltransferase involved in cell wall biosynthesis
LQAGVDDERGTLSDSDLTWGGLDAGTSSKPRLGFVFSALNTGGAERHAVTLRARLLRRGYPGYLLGVVTAERRALLETRDAAGAIELGARRILRSPSTWIRTAQAMRRLDADVVFLVNTAVAVMATGLRRLGLVRGKLVCVLHSTKLGGKERASWLLFRIATRSLDALVFVGEAQHRYWQERRLGGRALVINNGVDLERFCPEAVDRAAERRALGFQADDYVIGISAALRSEKRHCDLIDALAGLRARGIAAKLLMVGDGPERKALEAHVQTLGLQGAVVFAGDQRDVRPFLAAMDVGVLCSDFETFSLAALETLAMGVPLVASDVGSSRQVIEPGRNGFIFEPRRVDQLVEQLSRLADPSVRSPMAAAARASIARFSEETMVERFEELVVALTRAEPTA